MATSPFSSFYLVQKRKIEEKHNVSLVFLNMLCTLLMIGELLLHVRIYTNPSETKIYKLDTVTLVGNHFQHTHL